MGNTKDNLFYSLIQGNIYGHKKHDGILYIIFYIIIPVIITAWSLYAFPDDFAASVYCYLTIFVSTLNSVYDAINRWQDKKSIINVKLLIMIGSVSVVCVYCFVVIMGMLMTATTTGRIDLFFCVYFVTIIVALFDFACCFAGDLTMREYTKI